MTDDEQRAAILAEAHAHLARRDDDLTHVSKADEAPLPTPGEFSRSDFRPPKPPLAPGRTRTLDTPPEPRFTRRAVEQMIAEAIAAERVTQQDIMVRLVASIRNDAANEIERETRSLRLELTELATVVAELRVALTEARTSASMRDVTPLTRPAKH
jgi:hypothetical protein